MAPGPTASRPRVVLVDDHELFRNGLRDLLQEHSVEVVGDAAEGASALDLVRRSAPDVVVMDIHMPGGSGIEATRRIRATAPATRVLMLTVSADETAVADAILAGACGYLLKDASPDQIVAGVQAAAAGESLLSSRIAADLLERLREGGSLTSGETEATELTERELQVLRLMAEGMDNREIAEELVISVQTVKNHVSNVLAKLEVQNRIQAAVHAVRRRLL
jgi:DNA-binding NarL/FixJ family response regulator